MLNRLALLATLLLVACQPAPEAPLKGARIGGPFALTAADGSKVTDQDFAGKYRIVYFGYTNCPDVCPTDMANLGRGLAAFRKAEPDAPPVALVFVTVDPKRDTPAVAGQFARAFLPDATGLSGSQAAIDGAKKAYAVYSTERKGVTPGSYLVDHSRSSFLMDRAGKPIAMLPSEQSGEAVAAELARWVQ